jgi:hypothetical protein
MNITLTRAQILQAIENGMVTIQVFDPRPVFGAPLPPVAPIDHRPEGFRLNYGYRFPSRSGESEGHEVTIGWKTNVGSTGYACDCPAGRYGRKCWAVKAVENVVYRFKVCPAFIDAYGGRGMRTAVSDSFGNRNLP